MISQPVKHTGRQVNQSTLLAGEHQRLISTPYGSAAAEAALIVQAIASLEVSEHLQWAPRAARFFELIASGVDPLATPLPVEALRAAENALHTLDSDQRDLRSSLASCLCAKIATHASLDFISECIRLLVCAPPSAPDSRGRFSCRSAASQLFHGALNSLAEDSRHQPFVDAFAHGLGSKDTLAALAERHPALLGHPLLADEAGKFLISENLRINGDSNKNNVVFATHYPASFFFCSQPLWIDAALAPFREDISTRGIVELSVLLRSTRAVSLSTPDRAKRLLAQCDAENLPHSTAARARRAAVTVHSDERRAAAAIFATKIKEALETSFASLAHEHPHEAARCFFSTWGNTDAAEWARRGLDRVDAAKFLSSQLPSLRNVRLRPPHSAWPIDKQKDDPLSGCEIGYMECLVFSGASDELILKGLAGGQEFSPSFQAVLADPRIAVQFGEARLLSLTSLAAAPRPSSGRGSPRL